VPSPSPRPPQILRLRDEWQGNEYDLIKRNCNTFCEALTSALGVDKPPGWVNRLARGASKAQDTGKWLGKLGTKLGIVS